MQKTRKAAKKRIKLTGRGKILCGEVRMSHLKTKKSSKRLRRKSRLTLLARAETGRIKKLVVGI